MQAISNSQFYFPPIRWFSTPPPLIQKIRSIAETALAQLTFSLAVNLSFYALFGSYFVPPGMAILTVAVAAALTATLANLAIQMIWKRTHQKAAPSGWETFGGHLARTSLVNTLTLKLNRYIHELGHAGAAMLTFVKAEPRIIANSHSGSTTYNISYGLTRIGKFLGENRALVFTTAAGLAVPVLSAMAEFAIAHNISDQHPLFADLLRYHGISQLLDTILYCSVLAFNSSKDLLIHDSMMLWRVGGIHPLATLALVIAFPIAELCLLHFLKKK